MPDPARPNPARHRESALDWTITPAKWGAIGVMAAIGTAGLGWSIVREMSVPASPTGTQPLRSDSQQVVGPRDAAPAMPADGVSGWSLGQPEVYGPLALAADAPIGLVAIGPDADASPPQSTAREPAAFPGIAQTIDINTATAAELELLPGIGPSRARAIVEDRRANGVFGSVDELDRVRGIGPATIEGLRAFAAARAPS
ncbi:MAG: ComEA family DNA-binding protein [Phycisphaerales bacterium]|nr:ComEA family DNA-binding protein [Phycisphaerales bacterium]